MTAPMIRAMMPAEGPLLWVVVVGAITVVVCLELVESNIDARLAD